MGWFVVVELWSPHFTALHCASSSCSHSQGVLNICKLCHYRVSSLTVTKVGSIKNYFKFIQFCICGVVCHGSCKGSMLLLSASVVLSSSCICIKSCKMSHFHSALLQKLISFVTRDGNYDGISCCRNETELLSLVHSVGPVIAGVDATTWNQYMGGIIQYNCGSALNHAVQIVGYDLTGRLRPPNISLRRY